MIKRFVIAGALLILVFGGLVGFNMFRDQMIRARALPAYPQRKVAAAGREITTTNQI